MKNKCKLQGELGWYRGEEFSLLEVAILEILKFNTGEWDVIQFFHIKICKFCFGLGLYKR